MSFECIGPLEDDDDFNEDDIDEEEDLDDEVEDDDEERDEELRGILNEQKPEMIATPFSTPPNNPSPSFGSGGNTWWNSNPSPSTPSWARPNPQPNSTPWGSNYTSPWQQTPQPGQNQFNKGPLDRTKKFIFIDFIDAIVESYQSNGKPGMLPRDIYDIKPRFDVWDRLTAFNPQKLFLMIPMTLMNNTTGTELGTRYLISYYSACLAAYLRIPLDNIQAVCQGYIGQSKTEIVASVLGGEITKEDSVLIGIKSGMYQQNDADQLAAERCGITYYDLNQLLNSLY